MNILCTICSDLINQAESIYVTKCGHIFHQVCLAQWIERSKTCPQCRNKVTERCMFRIYPTVSNENSGEDATALQSRLDNAQLELRQHKAETKKYEDQIAILNADVKKQEEINKSYEKQLISFDSKVRALRDQLTYAKVQANETEKLREENESLKKNMQTLNGLQRVLNATSDEVEEMLRGYSDSRTIATFATALKRALCESESKKKDYQDRLHMAKQQLALQKKTETDLQALINEMEKTIHQKENKIDHLKEKLKTSSKQSHEAQDRGVQTPHRRDDSVLDVSTPRLNDAILQTNSNNSSFDTMVNQIENSDSPYLNLKQGGLLPLTALQRAPIRIPKATKPSEQLYLNSIKNACKMHVSVPQKTTSIFHKKEPMKIETFESKVSLDVSYDGMGGHSKPDTFPVPKRSPLKSCIPKLSAKHKLKRPNPTGNHDIEQMLKKIREK